ncbi:DUF1003 domain-containing protein [Neisseria sp. Ec49-e6-T10]|uniref:DUF1003 domain-containing protein n=1 Tax=Neisseria sp. Ec49-e6-T10 TaxID=3140744 RepID=UPI003EBDCDE5
MMDDQTGKVDVCAGETDQAVQSDMPNLSSDTLLRHKSRLANYLHLSSLFGDDWFAVKAEGFARFFGTPLFLVAQTVVVLVWMSINILGWAKFDLYPFILLNLAFSLQAAYAAPLILLAQTRQADREKARAQLEALHREDLAKTAEQRQIIAAECNEKLLILLQQNTELTQLNKELAERIERMTIEIHRNFTQTKQ